MQYTWGELESSWLQDDLICWDSLIVGAKKLFYKKNTYLFHHQEVANAAYVVAKGRFRITYYHEDGNEKQLYIAETGSLCGEGECICSLPYNTTAFAITDSEVYHISTSELLRRMETNSKLTQRLLEYEIRKTHLLQSQVISLSFEQASSRIARILLNLYQLYGKENEYGLCLTVKFTKNDIAGIVGTSRVTASSELSKMEQSGLLIKHNGYYYITNLDSLRKLVDL